VAAGAVVAALGRPVGRAAGAEDGVGEPAEGLPPLAGDDTALLGDAVADGAPPTSPP
jgi:hypothetical protein